MDDRRDSARIDDVLDAARVLDDLLSGVLDLGAGRAGRDGGAGGWRQRFGERSVVRAMAAAYVPDQLRKAADAADELVAALGSLGSAWTGAGRSAAARVDELGLGDVPAVLRDPAIRSTSPALREAHERVRRTIAVLHEARSAAILAEIRSARHGSGHPDG